MRLKHRHSTAPFLVAAFVCLPTAYSQQPAATPPTAGERIGGRVVSSGDHRPLAHAVVVLENQKTNQPVANATCDEDGRFRLDPVPPGKYRLVGFAAGHLSGAYQQHEGFSTAIVTGAGLGTDVLVLELTPASSIHGRVTDESGEPVARANVTLYRETTSSEQRVIRMRNAQTNDNGEYEMEKLPPARYFLSVDATPWYAVHPSSQQRGAEQGYRTSVDSSLDVAYPTMFYPAAQDSNEAEPIVLRDGSSATANMQMLPAQALTLTVHMDNGDAQPGRPVRFPQLMRSVFGNDEPVPMQSETVDKGDMRILGIPPGQYQVREIIANGPRMQTASVVNLTESSSVDLSAPVAVTTVQAKVHAAGAGTLPENAQLILTQSSSTQPIVGKIDEEGKASISDVPPGNYRLRVTGRGPQANVMSVRMDGHPSPGNRVRIGGTGAMALDITVTSSQVNVEGFVKRDGKGVGGSMVVLVPAGADTSEDLFRRDQSDLDGSFLLRNVVPGNYLLLAIDDGWLLRFTDFAAMQPYLLHATPVTVPATGSASMHLPEPIPNQSR